MAKVKKMAFGGIGNIVKQTGASVRNAVQAAQASRPQVPPRNAASNRPLTAGPQLKFMSDTLRGGMPAKPAGIGAQLRAGQSVMAGPARGISRGDLKKAGIGMKKGGTTASKRADGVSQRGKTKGRMV